MAVLSGAAALPAPAHGGVSDIYIFFLFLKEKCIWKGLSGTWLAPALLLLGDVAASGFPCLLAGFHGSGDLGTVRALLLLLKPDVWVVRWGHHRQGWEGHVPLAMGWEEGGLAGSRAVRSGAGRARKAGVGRGICALGLVAFEGFLRLCSPLQGLGVPMPGPVCGWVFPGAAWLAWHRARFPEGSRAPSQSRARFVRARGNLG